MRGSAESSRELSRTRRRSTGSWSSATGAALAPPRPPTDAELDALLADAELRRAALAGLPPRLSETQMTLLEAALATPGLDDTTRRTQLGRLLARQRARVQRAIRARRAEAQRSQDARDRRLGIEAGSIDEPETPIGDTASGPGGTALPVGDTPAGAAPSRPAWLEEQHRRWATHGSSSGGTSTPDSDAEMNTFEAIMLPPPQFSDAQAELIERAVWDPAHGGPGDAVHRSVYFGFLANHREQQAREARERGESEARVHELEEAARAAWWNRTRNEHRALIEEGSTRSLEHRALTEEWSEPPEPADSDAEGDRMVAELHRRLREDGNDDQQMELIEQAMRVELMDQSQLDTGAERREFRRRLVAHMEDRSDALRSPSPSEQSV